MPLVFRRITSASIFPPSSVRFTAPWGDDGGLRRPRGEGNGCFHGGFGPRGVAAVHAALRVPRQLRRPRLRVPNRRPPPPQPTTPPGGGLVSHNGLMMDPKYEWIYILIFCSRDVFSTQTSLQSQYQYILLGFICAICDQIFSFIRRILIPESTLDESPKW